MYESEPGVAGNLLARLPAAAQPVGKPLLLLHHMDVVPADRERWERDPFAGEIREGAIWGRGAMDMKGLGIIHLMTLLLLQRQGVELTRDVLLLAVADEETGGERGLQWMLDNHGDLLDVDSVFDEGGFGARDVLSHGRLVFNVAVVEKRILWMTVSAEGVAGHGSQPHSANPNDHLVGALGRILELPQLGEPPAVVRELRRRVGPLASNKFVHAITHTTTSLTTLRSGVGEPPKVNVIPSVATATLDSRLLPGVSPESFLQRARAALAGMPPGPVGDNPDPSTSATGSRLTLVVDYDSGTTPTTAWDTPLFGAIEAALLRHYPDAIVTPSPIPYGTDSNTLRQRGAAAYGLSPMVVSLDVVSSMHGDAERIPVDSFRRGVRIFYELVRDYGDSSDPPGI